MTENDVDEITTNQAARLHGVSVATITRMVARGELHPVSKRPGLRGAFTFRRRDVEALPKCRCCNNSEQTDAGAVNAPATA